MSQGKWTRDTENISEVAKNVERRLTDERKLGERSELRPHKQR